MRPVYFKVIFISGHPEYLLYAIPVIGRQIIHFIYYSPDKHGIRKLIDPGGLARLKKNIIKSFDNYSAIFKDYIINLILPGFLINKGIL
ncbi:hypothetical protein SAMN06265379_101274 [Saccharicrinis carchari]|uniref:Uncharacterized protein n=1 Tax=Saccharicrinis carchari TaxID=1168039 RepID=A0A521AMW4_SACCC|nr:hypothetical protein SAMN06265379_101274 [Saccharicrinis carchari]